jgi:hypothetical protein
MIKKYKWLLIYLALLLIILFSRLIEAQEIRNYESSQQGSILVGVNSPMIDATTVKLSKLIPCESGGNPNALNPMDKDLTPSWGILQFKPSTLHYFGIKYGLLPADIEPAEIMNRIWEADLQINVAHKMIDEYGTTVEFWLQQFPACSILYSLWE